jgi:simple sugar transport system ATP-binding protein
VIFVTHFLNQVYELTNRICVLRNGRLVGDHATADLPRRQLVDLMLGRSLNEARHVRTPAPTDARMVAKVKGLALKGEAAAFDLEFRAGDVVGAAGLLGSGRSETALLMFGALRADAGAIEIDGRAFRFTSPRQAIAHRFALLPESRKTDGIIGALSIRENIILALQARRGWLAPLTRKQQADIAQRFIALLDIRTPDAEKPIEQLSGGNQQKALIARWLATEPALFLLDEPTRGVDVGAHAEILKLIDAMGQDGMAVYLISSELGELVSLAERVSIMRDRRQADVLEGADVSAENILATIATPSAP